MKSKYNNNHDWHKTIRTAMITVACGLIVGFLLFGFGKFDYLLTTVIKIEEKTKDLPSVNGLIVTQEMLQRKPDRCELDSLNDAFCVYFELQKKIFKRQDSIIRVLNSLMQSRGGDGNDSTMTETNWMRMSKKLCKGC